MKSRGVARWKFRGWRCHPLFGFCSKRLVWGRAGFYALCYLVATCIVYAFACRNHGLPRANRGFRLSVSCHPPPYPPYLKRVIIIRMPTRPPRLNRVTSLLAETYCNPVMEHCNPNYHTPFPLVATSLLHVETPHFSPRCSTGLCAAFGYYNQFATKSTPRS